MSKTRTLVNFRPLLNVGQLVKIVMLATATVACVCASSITHAEATIKIGMVLPLSGPLAATGNDIAAGARAAIDAANKAGGIKGQKLELVIEDDRFDPKASEELARDMVKNKGVGALMSCFGTVSCLAVAKVTQDSAATLLGPIAGAEALRDAKFSRVYSLRANASEEIGTLLSYLDVLKLNATPVVVQDDGFGKAYANSLQSIAANYKFSPTSTTVFDPKTPNYADIASRLIGQAEAPPAVLLIANTVHSIGIIKALNDLKYFGKILNLAGQANAGFAKNLGKGEQLAIFATVTPSPFSARSSAAEAYRDAWRTANNNEQFSYIGFEAFLTAQVMLQALKRSTGFSPAAISTAISQLNNVRYHELSYSFTNKKRQAANYTDLAMLSNGAFRH